MLTGNTFSFAKESELPRMSEKDWYCIELMFPLRMLGRKCSERIKTTEHVETEAISGGVGRHCTVTASMRSK